MLDVFQKFAVNLDAEVNGVWRTLHGADFLIARSGNKNFSTAMTETYDQNEKKLKEGGKAADELADKLMCGVIADTLVLGWKNVGFKGEVLAYSRANVIKLLSPPEMRDFRAALLNLADDAEQYRLHQEAEQEKNS